MLCALAQHGFRGIQVGPRETEKPPRTLLLHGFTGLAEDWLDCWPQLQPNREFEAGRALDSDSALAVDLPGHGGSAGPEAVFDESLHRLLAALPSSIDRVIGYSLGGRLALGLLRLAPQRFRAAVILAAHPGLTDAQARARRRAADRHWIERLEQQGITAFVDAWQSLPLFATQASVAAERLAQQRERRLSQTASGLAASLRAHGLAEMPSMRQTIIHYPGKLHWVAGAEDHKFSVIARVVGRWRPSVPVTLLPDVGHNPLLEAPDQVQTLSLKLTGGPSSGWTG